jgi:hypothetical protein
MHDDIILETEDFTKKFAVNGVTLRVRRSWISFGRRLMRAGRPPPVHPELVPNHARMVLWHSRAAQPGTRVSARY